MKEKIIAIAGPTASGKSALAVSLAKKINAEIISADSMQVYKYMDIGTAKVTKEEIKGIKHYLVDCFYPAEEFNISIFLSCALKAVHEITSKGENVIIVGGSGLYLDTLLYKEYDFPKENKDREYRDYLTNLAKEKGNDALHKMLEEVDKKSSEEIHPNNVKRVIRALEIYKTLGVKKSELNLGKKEFRFENTFYFALNMEREKLYNRIDFRVEKMIEMGLVKEVEGLLKMNYSGSLVSMQGLGYKEIVRYLQGDITLEEAIYIIKRDTRHFAKRQLTWFRKNENIKWLDVDKKSSEEILGEMMEIING